MTDSYKKRANAGPTVGEKKQEEVSPEKHGNKKPSPIHTPKWIKIQCGRCGFQMGYRLDSQWHRYNFMFQCLGCHRKEGATT